MVDVLRVRALDGRRLALRFSDGLEGEFDCARILAKDGPMVQPLKDAAYFARVFIEEGAPTWPNGFDLDPIALYIQLRDAGALRPEGVAAE
ncbi:MAG: DUF2442 domain-containing protein [Proteobacteria bacterium]|nr:DUF2442 domain-containing protein [Pseudomonadota bacterium]